MRARFKVHDKTLNPETVKKVICFQKKVINKTFLLENNLLHQPLWAVYLNHPKALLLPAVYTQKLNDETFTRCSR